MKLDSLQKLFIHELKDLYSAESQLIEALPKVHDAISDDDLKAAVADHLEETKEQRQRLEQIFEKLEGSPRGHKCKAMEGLIKECEELLSEDIAPDVLDAALIAASQRVEHYEIAGYGTARTYAEKLGEYEIADMLQKTLDEEGAADRKLSRLAVRSINFQALV